MPILQLAETIQAHDAQLSPAVCAVVAGLMVGFYAAHVRKPLEAAAIWAHYADGLADWVKAARGDADELDRLGMLPEALDLSPEVSRG